MFFPIGDTPNPRWFTPWATYALIAINLLVFLGCVPQMLRPATPGPELQRYLDVVVQEDGLSSKEGRALGKAVTEYDVTLFRLGSRPAAPSLWTLFTSMFLHVGVLHLLGNLLFLWIFGDNVERRLGPAVYLGAYLSLGLLAGLGDMALRWGSHLPGVGASGAISGVLGAYFLWFPYNRVRLVVFLPPVVFPLLEVPARLVLGVYLLVDNLVGVILERAWDTSHGIAYGAHLGGAVGGLLLGWIWVRWLEPRRGLEPLKDDAPEAHLELAQRYLRERMPTAAYQEVCWVLDEPDCPPEATASALALLSDLEERVDLPASHPRPEGRIRGA